METAVLREDIHSIIGTLPERSLPAVFSYFTEPPFAIETDLTDEENAVIEESPAEYRADPLAVTPWRKVRRGSQL